MTNSPSICFHELGNLLIREAAYRICSVNPPHPAEKWERKTWGQLMTLEECYMHAGTILRAYPRARFRP